MAESFEQIVTTQLKEMNTKLEEHSITLARIEQKELNGEKQEEKDNIRKAHRLTLYRVLMGFGLFILAIFTALDKLGIV